MTMTMMVDAREMMVHVYSNVCVCACVEIHVETYRSGGCKSDGKKNGSMDVRNVASRWRGGWFCECRASPNTRNYA